jgi:hypothetical protein
MKNISHYIGQRVLLAKDLKIATIVKILDDSDKYVVSYYNSRNKFIHILITSEDIMEPEEYEKIRLRTNTIIDLLK